MLEVTKEEGVELTDEQLEAVSGGGCQDDECPYCGETGVKIGDDLWECTLCQGRYNGKKW